MCFDVPANPCEHIARVGPGRFDKDCDPADRGMRTDFQSDEKPDVF